MSVPVDRDPSVRSVRRAFGILRAFRPSDRALPLGEIALRAGLDKATARRLLITLIAERVVDQDPVTKGYSLALGVLELAAGATPCDDLRARAQPVLVAIAETTGATAFLGVVHDDAALCIARADGGQAIQIRAWSIGGRMPLNCGAGPRLLMAHRPPAEIGRLLAGPLEAMTPYSPTDPAALAAALARIRADGWALGIDDVVEGIASLAVPVIDRAGAVVATISISGLHVHMLDGDQPRHLDIVQAQARALGQRL